jgi:hypothetical protein
MTKSDRKWWQQVRAQGRTRYVLRDGLLKRGLPSGSLVTLLNFLPLLCGGSRSKSVPFYLIEFALVVLAFGWIGAVLSWDAHEKEFEKPEDDDMA